MKNLLITVISISLSCVAVTLPITAAAENTQQLQQLAPVNQEVPITNERNNITALCEKSVLSGYVACDNLANSMTAENISTFYNDFKQLLTDVKTSISKQPHVAFFLVYLFLHQYNPELIQAFFNQAKVPNLLQQVLTDKETLDTLSVVYETSRESSAIKGNDTWITTLAENIGEKIAEKSLVAMGMDASTAQLVVSFLPSPGELYTIKNKYNDNGKGKNGKSAVLKYLVKEHGIDALVTAAKQIAHFDSSLLQLLSEAQKLQDTLNNDHMNAASCAMAVANTAGTYGAIAGCTTGTTCMAIAAQLGKQAQKNIANCSIQQSLENMLTELKTPTAADFANIGAKCTQHEVEKIYETARDTLYKDFADACFPFIKAGYEYLQTSGEYVYNEGFVPAYNYLRENYHEPAEKTVEAAELLYDYSDSVVKELSSVATTQTTKIKSAAKKLANDLKDQFDDFLSGEGLATVVDTTINSATTAVDNAVKASDITFDTLSVIFDADSQLFNAGIVLNTAQSYFNKAGNNFKNFSQDALTKAQNEIKNLKTTISKKLNELLVGLDATQAGHEFLDYLDGKLNISGHLNIAVAIIGNIKHIIPPQSIYMLEYTISKCQDPKYRNSNACTYNLKKILTEGNTEETLMEKIIKAGEL